MTFALGKTYQADALEQKVIEFWRQNKTFPGSIENRRNAIPFVFLEGPPTANGLPHPGHVLTRTLKDSVCRYKTMRGFRVERKAGWDCHGLPVEIEVEKELGLKNKQDIEKYGVAKFNQKCRESVFRYKKDWEWMSERVGFWLDFEKPYVTLENDYIESVWWSLQEAWKKGLLFQGFRVAAYCPRCGTGLSSHEVGLGYKSVEEASVFVKFLVVGQANTFILAWTTTPWTLPGNIALAVGEDITYVKVKQEAPRGTEYYILAKDRLDALRPGHEIVEEIPGRRLVGLHYEPLFPFMKEVFARGGKLTQQEAGEVEGVNINWFLGKKSENEHRERLWSVVKADFVTTQEGTGVVHTAVMYGEDDYNLGMALGLPAIHTVNTEGKFREFVSSFAGKFVKDADPDIIEDLRARNLLYRSKNHTHDYPFCWRCNTPLIYYARNQWFIRMSSLRENLTRHNATVQWVPDHIRQGRFGEFIGNVRDWALSRDRYWGTPLPIWTCTKCNHQECVGSLQQLAGLGGPKVVETVRSPKLDLHKPAVDEIQLSCPKCKGTMTRDPNVIDTWYDSGAAQFAQWHYPFENKDRFQPVDFIAEGIDQTRGWFYTLLAESTFLQDRPSYRTVVVNGLVLDEKGLKMSKKLKNYTDPNEVFKQYGADSMRWYLLSSSAPFADKRFFANAIRDTYTRFFLTLWNTYKFFRDYAELDRWTPGRPVPGRAKRPLLDQWLLDRLETVSREATREADAYNLHKATKAVEEFVDDVSNWWLRRSRRRFWGEDASEEKEAAYATLWEALRGACALAAPFAPFVTEALWQEIKGPKDSASIHFQDYPAGRAQDGETALEREMKQIRALTEAARSLRSKAGLKTRVPLRKITLVRATAHGEAFRRLLPMIEEEVNVKEIVVGKSAAGLEDYEAKVLPNVVGREFKNYAKAILAAAREADPRALGRAVMQKGSATLAGKDLDKSYFQVTAVAAEGTLKADVGPDILFLDATLTPELEAEGWAREITRRIQEMRKDARLDLQDQIVTAIQAGGSILSVLKPWTGHIQTETRSREVRLGAAPTNGVTKEWDIEGEKITISFAKVAK